MVLDNVGVSVVDLVEGLRTSVLGGAWYVVPGEVNDGNGGFSGREKLMRLRVEVAAV